jgi:type II secretory pathway component PulC
MTSATDLGLAVLCAALVWCGPAAAEPLEVQHVLELGGERWRVAGTLASSITGAEFVIFEEEATRRSKIARPDDPPFQGITILAVLSDKVLLEVDGRAVQLTISRGSGTGPETLAAPDPAAPEVTETKPKAPLAFARVRLTMAEYQETVRVLRRALQSGDIGLGHNEQGIFGVVVNQVPSSEVVERLGLQPGDVVVAVDGMPAASEETALSLLDAAAPDRNIPYAFRRGAEVGQGVMEVVADQP